MNYDNIFVNRIGKTPKSFMCTNKLVSVFTPNSTLQFANSQLIEKTLDPIVLEKNKQNNKLENEKDINFVRIKGKFVKSFLLEKTSNNILGKNDFFISQVTSLTIPETHITDKTLKTLGCTLIKPGDIFTLEFEKELPLFEVSIGSEYVNEYLLKENFGNGFYIERHNTPHYHQPLDSNAGGFLIVGLILDGDLVLTKFKIPFGYGVYMKPDTLHSDAFLVGNYNVIYTKTLDYSTYLFINSNHSIIRVE